MESSADLDLLVGDDDFSIDDFSLLGLDCLRLRRGRCRRCRRNCHWYRHQVFVVGLWLQVRVEDAVYTYAPSASKLIDLTLERICF